MTAARRLDRRPLDCGRVLLSSAIVDGSREPHEIGQFVEARVGIEPAYTALQAAA